MLKKTFWVLILSFITINIFSYTYLSKIPVILFLGTGFSYNFPINTEYDIIREPFFADIPLTAEFDFRFRDTFSFLTGIDFIYGINSKKIEIDDKNYSMVNHSLFIRIPCMVKFYPMFYQSVYYQNFFIGIGGFLHIWAVNMYYNTNSDNAVHTGSLYTPRHSENPPGNIYTPVNLGFKLSVGNHFYMTDRILFGLEFYTNFLFIPDANGYYFNLNYKRGSNILLDFTGNVGLIINIGINLNENY